ncbi:hypothetical protein M406DRAFT_331362 [Cryphonectria parasitica EP155]|uniref:Uncharacterized protein n=1 Tax=Cryphonectria parasitica (strain ATCC 38755 / EP155) TaxID=660469 RepID=A0A9P5CPI8_CRYP1|nr:uncharacterized protein M406DRAFT_331362 [Cryphonectria parasitica EP155]KAF3765050.1 hypothetical protein M406DRAFT_331362 [Cryphonectria parasitica EP155]
MAVSCPFPITVTRAPSYQPSRPKLTCPTSPWIRTRRLVPGETPFTARKNTQPNEKCAEIFLYHAKLYVVGDEYDLAKLRRLTNDTIRDMLILYMAMGLGHLLECDAMKDVFEDYSSPGYADTKSFKVVGCRPFPSNLIQPEMILVMSGEARLTTANSDVEVRLALVQRPRALS